MDDTSKKHGRCRLLDECGLRATPPDGMENEEEEREKEKNQKIIGWKKIERTVFLLLLLLFSLFVCFLIFLYFSVIIFKNENV